MDPKLERRVERYIEFLKDGKFSTAKNNETMLRFLSFLDGRNISIPRKVIYFDKLKLACKVIGDKDFDQWSREDVEKLFAYMGGGEKYSQWSIDMEKSALISFFKWFYDTDDRPKFLKWLKRESPPTQITKEMLLTPEEIQRMIDATKNICWKGLIAAYTTGARPNEIHNLKLKNVFDEGDMIKIYVGSTGKMAKKIPQRPVYVIKFTDSLRAWLKTHPDKNNPESWLFVTENGNQINYDDMRKVIGELAKKAGVKKRVYPYIFRHSIATYLYGKYGSTYARRIIGHTAGSRMEAVYCHLNEGDIESVLRGQKPMENGFEFGNLEKVVEEKESEKVFMEFLNANKLELLKIYKNWMESKK